MLMGIAFVRLFVAWYLFSQFLGHQLDFLPGGHGVGAPRCVEEDKRHLSHTPETLQLVRETKSHTSEYKYSITSKKYMPFKIPPS